MTALEAFEYMNKANTLSMPIVCAKSGILVAALTPEDLRGMVAGGDSVALTTESLLLPVLEFINLVHSVSR